MSKLAIVIPVLGRVERLETTLVSVLENRPGDCEVLVVFNAPYDDPYNLAGEVRFVQARRGAGWVECVNAGIEQAAAPLLHVLAAGCEVSEGWTETPLRQFKDPQVAAVSPLVLDRGRAQIVTAGVCYRPGGSLRQVGQGRAAGALGPWAAEMQGPSLLAGFYRKSALDALGGFDRFIGDDYAAADAALHLKAQGYRTLLDAQAKVFASADLLAQRGGALGRAIGAERMFLRHVRAGKWPLALAAHALLVAGEFCRSLPRPAALASVVGRALAWPQFAKCRGGQRRLAALGVASESTPAKAGGRIVPRPHTAAFRAAGLQSANKG